MNLIKKQYFNDLDNTEIDAIIKKWSYRIDLLNSSYEWSKYLQNYLILTHKPELVNIEQLSTNDILLNRYFWFKKFYHSYSKLKGIDAGIEQQISALIEQIAITIEDFDWRILEQIDNDIQNNNI